MTFKTRTISRECTRLNGLSMVVVEKEQDWIRDSFTGKVEAAIFFWAGVRRRLPRRRFTVAFNTITIARRYSFEALMMDLVSLKSIQIASF